MWEPPAKSWGALDIWVGHSPVEGLLNLINGIASLNLELLGWTFGSLVPIWIVFIWHKRLTGFDRAMLVIFVALVGVLFFYWFTGTFYLGPRYWHTALLPVLVLSAGWDRGGQRPAAGTVSWSPALYRPAALRSLGRQFHLMAWGFEIRWIRWFYRRHQASGAKPQNWAMLWSLSRQMPISGLRFISTTRSCPRANRFSCVIWALSRMQPSSQPSPGREVVYLGDSE